MLISRDPAIEGVVRIKGDAAGPRVVMFCGIHGDEVSGIHAIEKLFYDLFAGSRSLARGSLVLARANAAAFKAGRRYVKHNMNRLFADAYGPEIDRTSYEFRRVQELKPLLEHCDYFLDFHSAPLADHPFIVAEQRAVEFYRRLGIPRIMTGWSKFSSGPIGGDTENYANARGAISATLESGSHFDKASNDIAYRAAVSMLSILSMLETNEPVQASGEAEVVEMYSVITKEADDFRYEEGATNFKPLRSGETFAYQNGQPLTVSEGSYLLIPMKPADTKLHEEVGYLGRRIQG
ncbi:MAG TPA: succinylglutamate desuccinylase/aspartoacylase family protein [Rhizobiaceae bacterium]